MTVHPTPGRSATWEEYERLGDPTARHSVTVSRLQTGLTSALPATRLAVSHVGWKVGFNEFGPDIMVIPASAVDDTRFEGIPSLVAEVVSTNRAADMVVKVGKYAKAGAPRYWIVDVRDRVLLALILVDGAYQIAVQLDDDNPVAELETGAGLFTVSLPDLLA